MGENVFLSWWEELEGCSRAPAPPGSLPCGAQGRRQLRQWEPGVGKINRVLQPWLKSSWDPGRLCLGQWIIFN